TSPNPVSSCGPRTRTNGSPSMFTSICRATPMRRSASIPKTFCEGIPANCSREKTAPVSSWTLPRGTSLALSVTSARSGCISSPGGVLATPGRRSRTSARRADMADPPAWYNAGGSSVKAKFRERRVRRAPSVIAGGGPAAARQDAGEQEGERQAEEREAAEGTEDVEEGQQRRLLDEPAVENAEGLPGGGDGVGARAEVALERAARLDV